MRITEAAARLGMSPRMLRYREDLGLLPPLRDRPTGRGHAHRQFTEVFPVAEHAWGHSEAFCRFRDPHGFESNIVLLKKVPHACAAAA